MSARLRPSSFRPPMPQLLPPGGRLGVALWCPGEWDRRGQGSPTARFCRAGFSCLSRGGVGAVAVSSPARGRETARRHGRGGYWPRTPPTLPRGWRRREGTLHGPGPGPIRVGKACVVYQLRPPMAFRGNVGVCWELSVLTASVIVISITARPSIGTSGSSLVAAFQL